MLHRLRLCRKSTHSASLTCTCNDKLTSTKGINEPSSVYDVDSPILLRVYGGMTLADELEVDPRYDMLILGGETGGDD
jgi:hypothetical protein